MFIDVKAMSEDVMLMVADRSLKCVYFSLKTQILSLATISDTCSSFISQKMSTKYPILNNCSLSATHFFQAKVTLQEKSGHFVLQSNSTAATPHTGPGPLRAANMLPMRLSFLMSRLHQAFRAERQES